KRDRGGHEPPRRHTRHPGRAAAGPNRHGGDLPQRHGPVPAGQRDGQGGAACGRPGADPPYACGRHRSGRELMKVRAEALLSLAIAAAALTALVVEALRYFELLSGGQDNLALLVLVATGLPLVLRTVWGVPRGQFAVDIVAS